MASIQLSALGRIFVSPLSAVITQKRPDLVQREGRPPWLEPAPRNRQGTGEVPSWICVGDPCAAAPPSRRGDRRQRALGTAGGDRLVPIVHETTYEALREVSPLLGSRSGLSTAEGSMAAVAAKLAELVALKLYCRQGLSDVAQQVWAPT